MSKCNEDFQMMYFEVNVSITDQDVSLLNENSKTPAAVDNKQNKNKLKQRNCDIEYFVASHSLDTDCRIYFMGAYPHLRPNLDCDRQSCSQYKVKELTSFELF